MPNDVISLERSSKKNLQSFFSKLSQKDLKTLYACSEIRKLATGQYLMKEGETDQTVYLLLDGKLKILKITNGQPREIACLHSGDWVGEIAFTKKVPRTASVIAGVPSRVMAINEAVFNALNAQTQLFLLKKLNDLANERIYQILSNERKLEVLNRRLIDRIHSERSQGDVNYGESEMIRGIIKKVPRLPAFASTLLIRLSQKNTSLREASDLIKQDPSSVAVVLKTVNSPYYGLRQKISDINHALVLIGFSRIYQLIIAEGLRRSMPNTRGFNTIQSHSVAISHIAYGLSLASRSGNSSEVATIGLLHDLGRVLMLLLKKQNPSLAILIDSLDHARLCAILLKEWGMPDILVRSLEFQSYPAFLPPDTIPLEFRNNIAILYLAHLCLKFLDEKSDTSSGEVFVVEYMRLLGWDQLDVSRLVLKHLLPTLVKGINGYPIAFRTLLEKYISTL